MEKLRRLKNKRNTYRLRAELLDDGDEFSKDVGDKWCIAVKKVRLGRSLEQRSQNPQTTLLGGGTGGGRGGRGSIFRGCGDINLSRRGRAFRHRRCRRRRRRRSLHHRQCRLIQRISQEHPQHDQEPEERF